MKGKGKWTPHIIAAAALVVFIVLGLACASAPPAAKLGSTLEETLGKPAAELEEMLGKTRAEFENLLGRQLKKDEVTDEGGYYLENYPKKGLGTFFGVKAERVSAITIGPFSGGLKGFVALVEQTDKIVDDSWSLVVSGTDGSRRWVRVDEGSSITITIMLPNANGNVFWDMSWVEVKIRNN